MKNLLALVTLSFMVTNFSSCKKAGTSSSINPYNAGSGNGNINPWNPGTNPGDPKPGDPKPGDPKPGDPKPGDPKPGDPKPGDPKPGDPKPGDPKPGDPKPGDFGIPGKGGYGNDSSPKEVPVTFIYVNSSTTKLTNNVQGDAGLALTKMNTLFKSGDGHQHLKFKIKNALEVVSDAYFNTSCDGNILNAIGDKYGTTDSMVMLFVNDLAGGCAGVSWLWTFPKDKYAVTLAEYRYPYQNQAWTPVVHEFTHSFGFHHTGNEYAGSVPQTGLLSFKSLVAGSGRTTNRSCSSDFKYFIDPTKRTTTRYVTSTGQISNTENGGILHNPYHNTMYPSFGGQPDGGFFGSVGYHYSFSWGFDCWYNLAKADF